MDKREITVHIYSDNGQGRVRRDYRIPVDGEMNVLNALEYVHTHLDPRISYRSSCRHGVCGACLMLIDGKRRLACETEVADRMEIDPFGGGENR